HSHPPLFPYTTLFRSTSALTAIGNDYGFEQVFSRQVEALGVPGDVAVGISTSGKSPNVLKGMEAAQTRGLHTIGLSGAGTTNPLDRKSTRLNSSHRTI